ncbi:hypothetical protein AAN09_24445, partial [Salmonella enterica subsp. enterica]|nr:hypothetical protein [Salmonella enterica subsp. enterica serovar Worthington]
RAGPRSARRGLRRSWERVRTYLLRTVHTAREDDKLVSTMTSALSRWVVVPGLTVLQIVQDRQLRPSQPLRREGGSAESTAPPGAVERGRQFDGAVTPKRAQSSLEVPMVVSIRHHHSSRPEFTGVQILHPPVSVE